MKKHGTSGTVLLPSWTQEQYTQEDKHEKEAFQNVPSLEQNTEHAQVAELDRHEVPKWVGVVRQWTPEMTVKAWPVIEWIIREDGESEAIEWTCNESAKFFRFDLTSNLKNVR